MFSSISLLLITQINHCHFAKMKEIHFSHSGQLNILDTTYIYEGWKEDDRLGEDCGAKEEQPGKIPGFSSTSYIPDVHLENQASRKC